jgi:hypothetical protein
MPPAWWIVTSSSVTPEQPEMTMAGEIRVQMPLAGREFDAASLADDAVLHRAADHWRGVRAPGASLFKP